MATKIAATKLAQLILADAEQKARVLLAKADAKVGVDTKANASWRVGVNDKLTVLSHGYETLTGRVDNLSNTMATNTDLTKEINQKIDLLITATAPAVDFTTKAKWTAHTIRWLIRISQIIMVQVGQLGVGLLFLLTLYFVFKGAGGWAKAFVNIFNGNL